MRKTILSLLLISACFTAFGQTKAETRLYNKTMAQPTLSSYDKFLKKYPSGFYSQEIAARKDTLLNISPYDDDQAYDIARKTLPGCDAFVVNAWRKEAVDHIDVVCLSAPGLDLEHVRFYSLVNRNSVWEVDGEYYEVPSASAEGMSGRALVAFKQVVEVRGTDFIYFKYLLTRGNDARLVVACYAPSTDEFQHVSFTGKVDTGSGYHITGRPDNPEMRTSRLPQHYRLQACLDADPWLVTIPEKDYLTDSAIEKWLGSNPEAMTSATKVNMLVIPDGSSLIEAFASAKDRESSSRYTAALFDIRGYSVIVAYQKAYGNYVLAWAEPQCKDRKRDRLLKTIYFEDASTLQMYYYQYNIFFKYYLNLASKTLRR